MSSIHWLTSRVIPFCILGGAAFYLFAFSNTIPSSEKYLLLAFLAVMLITMFSRGLLAHPAYAPSMVCVFLGILLYESWQQNGPHSQSTILLGVLLAIILLINFSKFTSSPDI